MIMIDPLHGLWWIPLLLVLAILFRSRRAYRARWRRDWLHEVPRPPELDEGVRARLELVDQLESRVTELENRLDFTERLLAQRSETSPGLGQPTRP